MFLFLRKKENVFRILLCLYFAYLLWSRLAYLNADSPAYWIDVEEKATAYNARNKVLFGDPSSGGNHYEPMVSSPLPAVVSYVFFLLLGVSLFSLRLPYVLLSVLAIFVFYKVLKKEMNPLAAFLGIVLFGSAHCLLLLNRSATVENLFLLGPAVSLFFYQDYSESESSGSAFLFGLFSALNVAVKYSGVYFLVVSAVSILALVLKKERGYPSAMRSCLSYGTGVVLGLSVPVLALYYGNARGALEVIKLQCAMQGGIEGFFSDNFRFAYPLFFMMYFPFISLSAMAGLFSMFALRSAKLSGTDRFILLWLILGSVVSFFSRMSDKRLIFLLIPIFYVTVRGGYFMWQYLKAFKSLAHREMSLELDRRKGTAPFIAKAILGFAVIFMISLAAKYAFSEHPIDSFFYRPILMPLTDFITMTEAHAAMISRGIFLALLVLPVLGAVPRLIHSRDFYRSALTLRRCFVAVLFLFLVVASGLSIVTNESRNAALLFHPKDLAVC